MDARTAYLRPSGAGTWSACDGYAKLAAEVAASLPSDYDEETDTEVREDGTAAHWLNEETWNGRNPPIDSMSPNNRPITEEMYEGAAMYHEVLNSWPNVVPHLEAKVPVSRVIWGCQDGTTDAFAFDPTTYTLYVGDYKFGFIFVEVWRNLQLSLYAAGLIHMLDLDITRLTIRFYIVQPRSYHRDGPVREWVCTGMELQPIIEWLRVRAMAAMGPDPICRVNPGCVNCVARHACSTFQNAAMQAMEMAGASTPHMLTPWQMGNELRMLEDAQKRLEGRISGLKEQAAYAIRNTGQVVPYYDMRPGQGRETFTDGSEAKVLHLAKFYNVDAAKETRAKTPAQLRKAGFPSDVLARYTHRPSLGPKLTRSDSAEKYFNRWSKDK